MIKKLICFAWLVFGVNLAFSQAPGMLEGGDMQDPVMWTGDVNKHDDGIDLIIIADIQKDWHIFSQHTPEGGGLPLDINFHESEAFELNGETQESETIEQFSDIFEV